jgi:HD domain
LERQKKVLLKRLKHIYLRMNRRENSFPSLDCDYQLVLSGAAIHDAGKIIFPNEINGSGNRHELEGEKYLIDLGITSHITRFCRTHPYWQDSKNTLEDLLVSLADVLWKGCRNEQLENLVIKTICNSIQKDFWDVFITADSLFEQVSDRL